MPCLSKLLCTAICFIFSVHSFSQFKVTASSEEFDEPEAYLARIVAMQGGSTAFVQANPKGKLLVSLYDINHKLFAQKEFKPSYGKLRGAVDQIFEMNGDIIVTAVHSEGKTPVFYRIIINGKTGDIKEEKIVADLNMVARGDFYAIMYRLQTLSGFHVRVSQNHEYYAIVASGNMNEGLVSKVIVYDKKHREVSIAIITLPKSYTFVQMLDYAIDNMGTLYVSSGGYKKKSKETEEDFFLTITKVKKGNKGTLTPIDITVPEALKLNSGIIRHNSVTNKLVLLAYTTEYYVYSAYLDADTKTLSAPFNTAVDAETMSKMKQETGISEVPGEPQQLFINEDGSFLIVRKKSTFHSTPSSSGVPFIQRNLTNILISQFDHEGKLTKHYIIPRLTIEGNRRGYFLDATQPGKVSWMGRSGFEDMAIVTGKTQSYVLFNERPENLERIKRKEPVKEIGVVSACNAIVYPLSGDKILPDSRLFIQATAKEQYLGMFCIGATGPHENSYTTLILEIKGKRKKARLIRLQYE